MTERMKAFLQKVSADEALAAKVGAMGRDELIALAEGMGLPLTDEDLAALTARELCDDELDDVAGGGDITCVCPLGGGGTKDDDDKACACVLAGAGYTKDGGDRCVCGFAGYGYDT